MLRISHPDNNKMRSSALHHTPVQPEAQQQQQEQQGPNSKSNGTIQPIGTQQH